MEGSESSKSSMNHILSADGQRINLKRLPWVSPAILREDAGSAKRSELADDGAIYDFDWKPDLEHFPVFDLRNGGAKIRSNAATCTSWYALKCFTHPETLKIFSLGDLLTN
jgi:hypothetical protein